jgi:predicted RNase H-like HicB family nuclease
MTLTVELEQEEDGRWIAEVMDIPGALAYGQDRQEAFIRAQALALHALADKLEHGELAGETTISFLAA